MQINSCETCCCTTCTNYCNHHTASADKYHKQLKTFPFHHPIWTCTLVRNETDLNSTEGKSWGVVRDSDRYFPIPPQADYGVPGMGKQWCLRKTPAEIKLSLKLSTFPFRHISAYPNIYFTLYRVAQKSKPLPNYQNLY